DFEEFQLLLIDMGTRSTGGYAIAVSDVYEEEDVVTVELRYTYPEADCSVIDAETTPYLFLRLETQLPVVLSEEVAYTEC
ncbi:MAG: protease complex subunit PrcB family protein, partial [Pseudomonadota bacterium]|nr:protease complex subunit PrcB family protein [Pseudomonadota bacterium]